MCYTTVSCTNYSRTKCFKNCKKNISTDGEVRPMSKVIVACFFLGHDVLNNKNFACVICASY